MNYSEYLHKRGKLYHAYMNSIAWKNRRQEIILLRGNNCEKCKSEDNLDVHHSSYKKLGNESDDHLHVLCRVCHMKFHTKYNLGESMINKTMNFIYGKGWRKK